MAAGTPHVLLPWDNALIFQRNLQSHTGPLASWTAWVVPPPCPWPRPPTGRA